MNAISQFPQSLARADEFKPTRTNLRSKKCAEKALQKDDLRTAAANLDPIARKSPEGAAWAREVCLPYPNALRMRAAYYRWSDRETVAKAAEQAQKDRDEIRKHPPPRTPGTEGIFDWGWSDLFLSKGL